MTSDSTDDAPNGRYRDAPEPAVVLTLDTPVAPPVLWDAVASADGLAHWFPSTVTIEGGTGGTVTLSDDPDVEPSVERIVEWTPGERFEFEWGGDRVALVVHPRPGGSRLELVNVLDARDAAARNAAGWHICLDRLAGYLAGDATREQLDWEPVYERYRADGFPSGAFVPRAVD